MKNVKLKRNQKGFTIIEVMIVLAIAGLIMVIVFLAVPALQRSSRNTQRNADAAKIAASVASCMANRNGIVTSCDTSAKLTTAGGLQDDKLQQLTFPKITVVAGPAVNVDPADAQSEASRVSYGSKCGPDGASSQTAPQRQASVMYDIEGKNGLPQPRCIDV